jgi:putative transposase
MATRRQTFRLYPSKAQEKALHSARRLHCYLYNACVSHREYEYKRNRRTVTYLEQQNLLPEFKKVLVEFAQVTIALSLLCPTREQNKPVREASRRLTSRLVYHSPQKRNHIRTINIGVTEKLNVKGMTRKGGKRKAGLNKSILSVGFGTLNRMLSYKIEQKGGLVLMLPTKTIKPSQRCPKCGAVHKAWADLSNRYHVCPACGFEIPRDRGSVMVMYNVALNQQSGLGTSLVSLGCLSTTSKSCGSMKQLGQRKRLKSRRQSEGGVSHVDGVSPSACAVG